MSPLRASIILAVLCLGHVLSAPFDELNSNDEVPVTPLVDTVGYRLVQTIVPRSYEISLRPYLLESDGDKRFTFEGEVRIRVTVVNPTRELHIHAKNLTFITKQYFNDGATAGTNLGDPMEHSNVTDIMKFNLGTEWPANAVRILHFKYTGYMADDMHGFYRSSYTDTKNNTKWLGSTQFQTNHARRAFPCFDEPYFKATYQMNITRHRSMNTVSNTRIVSSALEGEYYTDVYTATPVMSSYLLAFIVSEFTPRTNAVGNFTVVARPESYAQTEYSHEVGQEMLKWFDQYFELSYTSMGNDKMHMAAIPDFSAGAMENWGLLTYRERALLFEEGSTTLSAKQYIAAVVSHEQAHMWFGDLVTCEWWSYTWLNEGFARYFQYFGTAQVAPEFQTEKQFVVDQIQSVMSMDSTNNTNPMTNPETYSPADLSRMFNSISYNKGGTIIRMIRHILGEEKFRQSLATYLNKYKFGSSIPKFLFDEWKAVWPTETVAKADSVLSSFTEQVGYPLVTINVTDTNRKSFQISQKRFLLKSDDGSNSSLLYTIPITYTTSAKPDFESTTPQFYLDNKTTADTHNVDTAFTWIIANIQETGYYRVNYDEASWHRIHHALYETNWGGIHEQNRAQIVDDLLNLARAGEISYDLALQIVEYMETETNYLPWTAAFNGLSFIGIRLGTDLKNFGTYVRMQTEKAYKSLGFEERTNDTALEIYNRAKILAWSCKYENSECISKAKTYFTNLKSTPVPVNIRSVVYCSTMRQGSEADFDTLFNKYKTETVATEQTLILNSLGCVKEQKLIEKYYNIIVSDEVRRQDKSAALSSLYTENNENIDPVFKLVTAGFHQLAASMGSYSDVATVISNIASRFTEEKQLTDLQSFNNANKEAFGTSAATLVRAETTVADNLAWSKSKLTGIKDYLSKRSGSGSTKAFAAFTIVLFAVISTLF